MLANNGNQEKVWTTFKAKAFWKKTSLYSRSEAYLYDGPNMTTSWSAENGGAWTSTCNITVLFAGCRQECLVYSPCPGSNATHKAWLQSFAARYLFEQCLVLDVVVATSIELCQSQQSRTPAGIPESHLVHHKSPARCSLQSFDLGGKPHIAKPQSPLLGH